MKKIGLFLICFAVLSSLVLLSCGKKSGTTGTESTTSGGQNWLDKFGKPQYGGTASFSTPGLMAVNFDVYNFIGGEYNFWFEAMFEPDWTLDRNTWPMNGMFTPDQYWKGNLAESWEIQDLKTIIVHIRKGIHWQNKPPVNGREFTAEDVVAHYDRILGTGHGYTWPSAIFTGMAGNMEKVTAKDNYTVVYKFKNPSAMSFQTISDRWSLNCIEAPEWVALGGKPVPPPAPKGGPGPAGPPPPGAKMDFGSGPLQDWHNAVGTGPWMLEKFVPGTSFTYVKNPTYWGHDPRNPENQVPYLDKLVLIVIPDVSTQVAALRTGKIDFMGQGGGGMSNIDWRQAKTITSRNPEFLTAKIPNGALGITFKLDKKPFTDIRVRKAMNMAIDRKAIAKSILGGTSNGLPVGMATTAYKGFAFDYNDWPQSLKDEYAYNPQGAKKLLAEAGFPNGFKTNVIVSSSEAGTITLMQAYKSYFKEVGIDMDIKTMDSTTYQSVTRGGKTEALMAGGGGGGITGPPTRSINMYYSKNAEIIMYGVNDSKYDALHDDFLSAPDLVKAAAVFQKADRYVLEQHWGVPSCEDYIYAIWHPYLKGYSGETMFWGQQIEWSRLWIDKSLKK